MDEKPSLSLGDFGISTSRGFLPDPDPLTCLPKEWEFLDQFGRELPSLIEGRTILVAAKDLSLPTEKMLERLSQPELNRAMTIYGFAASAFVHSCNVEPIIIRSKIAWPLWWLSKKIGKPPILSYCSYALNNWKRKNTEGDIEVDNLQLLQNFIKLPDEDWFILIHVDIEKAASCAINGVLDAVISARNNNSCHLLLALVKISVSLGDMIRTLKRMPEKCSPEVYYKKVRPWIMMFKNVVYEGVDDFENRPQTFRGETGAQSSIMPLLEAGLGLSKRHEESVLTKHLSEMRLYMPIRHREFIEKVEITSQVREFIEKLNSQDLKNRYNYCIEKMIEFRDIHLEYATSYIHQRTKDPTGTGGTIFMPWLEQMRNETKKFFL